MADLTANLKMILTYPAPGGGTVTVPQISTNVPYQASSVGFIDIPADVSDSDEFEVPFGSVGTGATMVLILNGTDQDLEVDINAAGVSCEIPAGGHLVIDGAALPAGVPVTGVKLIATASGSVATRVGYFVFGDPEPAP